MIIREALSELPKPDMVNLLFMNNSGSKAKLKIF
jgi:hypothetical protein